MKKLLILLVLVPGFFLSTLQAQSPVNVDRVYKKKLDNWQRDMSRWKMKYFVPLVGLHLLKDGANTFGRSSDNDIVILSENAPEFIGTITKNGTDVSFTAAEGINPKQRNRQVASIQYTFDADRNSERLRDQFITWYIQFVGDDFFLRVLDDQNPLISTYQPYDYFPASEEFIFTGKYKKFRKTKTLQLDNVIATKQEHTFIGEMTIEYQGSNHKLLVMEGNFLMFADQTNGDSTFPHGRYLRLKQEDDEWIIDFNYSFSPPRSVSDYTTCDIPPVQNHLPFAITAGEKFPNTGETIITPVNRN